MKKTFIYIITPIIVVLLISSSFKVYAADTSIPDIKYIWVGKPEQMTPGELNFMANNYKMIVFNEAHVGGDQTKIAETARLLKEKNPNILIFNYFKTTVHVDTRIYSTTYSYKESYRLRDKQNKEIPFFGTASRRLGSYSDLSDSNYRQWVFNVLDEWFKVPHFDGVAFDVAKPLYPYQILWGSGSSAITNTYFYYEENKIAQKILDFNEGLKTLIRDVNQKFQDKLIIYNGVNSKKIDPTKNDGLLKAGADYIMDEGFCFNTIKATTNTNEEIMEEINFMKTVADMGKKILIKTNYPQEWHLFKGVGKDEPEKISWAGRLCYGVFLMGYQPGSSFFKYGYGYSVIDGYPASEITDNSEEINIPLGSPIGNYKEYMGSEYVLQRNFTNGYVYVNLEDGNRTIILPAKLTIMNGGVKGKTYQQGQTIEISSKDSLFLLINPTENQTPTPTSIPTTTPTSTPTIILGDITDEGDIPQNQVNYHDFNLLKSDYGKTGTHGWIPSDIDKNGIVNIFDYNILVDNFDL